MLGMSLMILLMMADNAMQAKMVFGSMVLVVLNGRCRLLVKRRQAC